MFSRIVVIRSGIYKNKFGLRVISTQGKKRINFIYIVRKLIPYVWPKDRKVRVRVVGAVSCLLAAKAISIQTPFIFKLIIDRLNLQPESFIALSVAGLVIAYGISRISSQLFSDLRLAIFSKVSLTSITTVNMRVFKHLMHLDMAYHTNKHTGAVVRIIQRGSSAIQTILTHVVFNMFPLILETLIVSGILKYKCGTMTALASVTCIAMYFVFTLAVTQWRLTYRKRMNEAEADAGNKVVESLLNIETVKYHANEDFEAQQYGKTLKTLQDASHKTSWSLAFLNVGQNAIISCGMTAIMLMSVSQIQTGLLTIGDLAMINGLLFQLAMPLNFLGTVYRDLRQATTDIEALFDLLAIKSQHKFLCDKPLQSTHSSSIIFDNVHFKYDENGEKVMDGVSLHIPGGTSAAIVGTSGCGKSTVAKLLFRLYNPQSGGIFIDGQDISSVSLKSLRSAISLVPQDCILFNDSIRNNILYGDLSANDEALGNAFKLAGIDKLVESLPDHYDTMVGERGVKLSGGEKQRIAIARALVGRPRIVVCDEATSSLDAMNEQNIARAIRRGTRGRTTLIIAHRLSTIMHVDKIFVMSGGRITEEGTHWELISSPDSLYRHLWAIQNDSSQFSEIHK